MTLMSFFESRELVTRSPLGTLGMGFDDVEYQDDAVHFYVATFLEKSQCKTRSLTS